MTQARLAVVLLVDERGWVLLQERDEHAPRAANQWGLVGGHVEDGEDFATAVYREALEETGLDLPAGSLRLWRDDEYTYPDGHRGRYQIFAGRVSLGVSVTSVALATLAGVWLGLLAGYFGGWTDTIIMRAMDLLLSFPTIVLAIAIVAMLGASMTNLVLVIAIVYVPRFVRIVSPLRKFLGDNPDAVYFNAPVRGDRSYRIRGNLAGATYTSLTVEGGNLDGKYPNRVVSALNDTQFDVAADGSLSNRRIQT